MFNFKHLKESRIGYFSHLFMCIRIAYYLLIAIPFALLHGLFPFMFQETCSKTASKLIEISEENKARIKHSNRH